jgi:hypothetical protein
VRSRAAAEDGLSEPGRAAPALEHVAEPPLFAPIREGAARAQQQSARKREAADESGVGLPGVEVLRERQPVRRRGARLRAPRPVLSHRADGCEDGAARAVVPEQARPQDAARERGQVGPAVVVPVLPLLAVEAAQDRSGPFPARRLDHPERGIGRLLRARVEERLPLARARPLRHQVHDAADRGRPVERRGGSLDDLDLPQVQRGHLQQAQ